MTVLRDRGQLARGLARARRLDLDHVGAHVGEVHRAERRRHGLGEVDDADTLERLHLGRPPPARVAPVVAVPEREVVDGVPPDVLDLVVAHLAHGLGRHAHDEPARRHHLALRHERPAPTCAPSSTTAPVRTTAPMPMRTLSMMVQAWTTQRWPMVTPAPTMHGNSGVTWSTELSCTLEFRPSVT